MSTVCEVETIGSEHFIKKQKGVMCYSLACHILHESQNGLTKNGDTLLKEVSECIELVPI